MPIKTKVLVAAATLTLAGGLGTAGALPASAATTQCGQACIQIFSAKFGTPAQPTFIETVFLGIPAPGVPTILHRGSPPTRPRTSSSRSAARSRYRSSTPTAWSPPPATAPTYFPLVNGSTTDFSHPFGMTIWGNPGHELFPQIKVEHLTGNPADVPASQLWGATSGPAA
jgi:hypothetical protein